LVVEAIPLDSKPKRTLHLLITAGNERFSKPPTRIGISSCFFSFPRTATRFGKARALTVSIAAHALIVLAVGFGASVSQWDVKAVSVDISLRFSEESTAAQSRSDSHPTPPKPDHNLKTKVSPIASAHTETSSFEPGTDHRVRERFVSSLTTPTELGDWMARWRAKVEATGTAQAQNTALSSNKGDVLMLVSVMSNGHVNRVKVLSSSGDSALDQMARDIALTSGPFDPLPQSVADQTDVLHITRTWRFGATALGNVQ